MREVFEGFSAADGVETIRVRKIRVTGTRCHPSEVFSRLSAKVSMMDSRALLKASGASVITA